MTSTQLNIDNIRKEFPNLAVKVHNKPLIYFDNAATTLKPQVVIDAVTAHYRSYTSNVHRGVHALSEKATAAYEGAREKVKTFINAPKSAQIIFTRGTTESINLVAQSFGRKFLNKGDEILISAMEHHSNIVPWQMLCEERGCVLKVIPMNDKGELIYEEFLRLLSDKTKFISIVYISNSLGTINPVKDIIDQARQRNIPVLVDAAQAITHGPIDVQSLDCDFLAFSAHKMYGPTGVGVLYGKESLLNQMPPYQGGGDMISSVTFEKTTYNTIPYKFEAGTPNVAGVIGLGAAVDYMLTLDFNLIATYKKELLEYATAQLNSIEGLRFIGQANEKTSIISFVMKDIHPHDLGTIVDSEGVAIRTGHHCTQPVMKYFNVPATARASLAHYNTKDEIDILVKAIHKAKTIFK
ncbi:MAG: cysteine desulfurase [Candidatus Omnitrophica bacterium]|nr:cysteine desulfurase [Candidatus Omnitrophota bacterium]